MNEEMQLRYIYFLTNSAKTHEEWEKTYAAWEQFRINIGTEEYSELMDKVRAFYKKYKLHRKRKK